MQNYTNEQKKDILERVNKANEYLKELNLSLAAQTFTDRTSKTQEGYDVFGIGVVAFLKDTKYDTESPKEEKAE